MTSIKLLPGVGYTGLFNAQPSIRGGDPGDLTAVLDGFYIEQPYHWGGGFSIFDPKMVSSAQLSHGVFSTRYGHTVSGLLEVNSRRPSNTETEFDLGISSSATHLNLSLPLWGKGGIMVMGKVTYWDPFVWAAKQFIEEANYVRVAPYIRSGALSAYYRFNQDLEWTGSGFFGSDGIGVSYENNYDEDYLRGVSDMSFDWDNKLGFFITGLTFNPQPSMVIKGTLGAGFYQSKIDGFINNNLDEVRYSADFRTNWGNLLPAGTETYELRDQNQSFDGTNTTVNYQGRLDFDWDLGHGFLFALGAQELYSQWIYTQETHMFTERSVNALDLIRHPQLDPDGYITFPVAFLQDMSNQAFTSSAYTLLEYSSPNQKFGAELGFRVDHLHFIGGDFSIKTWPVLNPRLNMDFNIIKNKGIIDSLSAVIGTGLFSSMTDNITSLEARSGIEDFEMKQNRSWTSVAGTKIDFLGDFSLNIEGYFKYVFDRAYTAADTQPGEQVSVNYRFDGEGVIWGFDLMLRKFEARYWDGWLSYSFNHARYRNPHGELVLSGGEYQWEDSGWFFPDFHRFHNLNLVMNIKPVKQFNIMVRLGLASGRIKEKITGQPETYPVYVLDESGNLVDRNGMPFVIEKWKRDAEYDDDERTTWSIPLDLKLSYLFFNETGKVQAEIYLGIENLLSLIYRPQANTTFNSYTGQEDEGSDSASYEMPFPMVSCGFKWSY
jgi:hypothetical protein